MLDIIPSSGSKNDTSMKPMNIQSRITIAGSITDMNVTALHLCHPHRMYIYVA